MKKIVVAYKPLPPDVLDYLRAHVEVVQVDAAESGTLAAALKNADGAIGASVPFTPDMLAGAGKLKALSTISVGFDNFDVADLTRRGIVLTNTPDVLTESTADTVFALILASARRVVELAEWVKAGGWTHSVGAERYGVDVQGKTLGIFGMRVLYTNRHPNPHAEQAYGARRVELADLLAQADFVCLQVPFTPETHHLIGAAELAMMKKSAILINAARGAIVDENALIEALRAGTIRGAGLDVFEQEPLPATSPLLAMPNVVALPHIGSATHETRYAMARCAAENIVAALDGTLEHNIVNQEALTRCAGQT